MFADDSKVYRNTKTHIKANMMLGMVRRAYTYKDGGTIKKLYISLIRPILEYGNDTRVPSLTREQQQIENVQRRATKMVPELRNLEYTDRLRVMKLPSMYYRRARGDMIEVYKYLHGQYNVEEVPLLLDEWPGDIAGYWKQTEWRRDKGEIISGTEPSTGGTPSPRK